MKYKTYFRANDDGTIMLDWCGKNNDSGRWEAVVMHSNSGYLPEEASPGWYLVEVDLDI